MPSSIPQSYTGTKARQGRGGKTAYTDKMMIRQSILRRRYVIAAFIVVIVAIAANYGISRLGDIQPRTNPLAGKRFYVDNERPVTKAALAAGRTGKAGDAALLRRISDQPGSTWLTGPSSSDPAAQKDIASTSRTSAEARAGGSVPIYVLYAIPRRDACAPYSQGGFQSSGQYLAWIDRILQAVKTKAVFIVEPDAVAQTLQKNCLTETETSQRYELLRTAIGRLDASGSALGIYLDAGHSEWQPDPTVLVGPLKKSGVEKADGIAVNVSFFVATPEITSWATKLAAQTGGGVVIDTSRNGRGVPPKSATGEARWCNPAGRGLGPPPMSRTRSERIDAYLWIKNPGESDGSCSGRAPAGTFVPELALELARNAESPGR